MMRIGFLFNHDQTHQVAHSLPIARALAERGDAQIILIVTSPALAQAVRAMAAEWLHRANLVELSLKSSLSRMATRFFDDLIPARKLLIYRDNVDFFRGLDALVVAEKSSLLLKSRYGLDNLKIIHTRHGAGDRAIGFNKQSAQFDLTLVSGPKIRDRLISDAGVAADNIAMVGYAKFDDCADIYPPHPLFTKPGPIVLYNPHPSPKLSSWYQWGGAILRQFAAQDRYNLIFAPHVMLYARRWTVTIDPPAVSRVPMPPAEAINHPRIHIDLGSAASNDMQYTNVADVYMGDVSSQIYEFLIRPRPCLFLNAHHAVWRNNADYRHWQAGPVLESANAIVASVESAMATHSDFESQQRAMLAETFSLTQSASATRGADAIWHMLAS